jgi:hypothetical protein
MNRKWMIVFTAAALAGVTGWAQTPAPRGGGAGMSPFLLKLFGNNKAFSAHVVTTVTDGDKPVVTEMNLSMLDGKLRTEMDRTKAKGIPPEGIENMKRMGLDRMVMIDRPDKKTMFVIFPSMGAYSENAYDEARTKSAAADYTIKKTSLGQETIDGHPCEKSKMTITDDKREKHEAVVWSALDLRNFPLQMEAVEDGKTIRMRYTSLKLEKPDAKLFEAPAEFTMYRSQDELMLKEMMKRRGRTAEQKEP